MKSCLISDNIHKSFGRKEVLRGFSFKAESSQITFLAGKNGAGKTTWLRIASGILSASKGKILFDGLCINKTRNKLAIVFDEPPVYRHLNGNENLRQLSGSKINTDHSRYILDVLNLDPQFLKKKAGHYSLGQRHRLAVAAALIRHPSYVFLDEPSIGLDPYSWDLVSKLLINMVKNGATIVVTGQDFNLMEKMADKIIVLNQGESIFEGKPKELISRFPVTIFVHTDDIDKLQRLVDTRVVTKNDNISAIDCCSPERAKELIELIKQNEIQFEEIYIKKMSLEESFAKLVDSGDMS